MSKERELLKRFMHELTKEELCSVPDELQAEIEELLAQPEQEPVAWMYDWDDEHERTYVNLLTTDTEHKHLKTAFNVIPLYTTPPTREPLSDEAVCQILIKKEWRGFVELVRIIEKAHGIGGGNE